VPKRGDLFNPQKSLYRTSVRRWYRITASRGTGGRPPQGSSIPPTGDPRSRVVVLNQSKIPFEIYTVDDIIKSVVELRVIRDAAGVTQADLAERLGMQQSHISRIEHQSDWRLSTISSYLESLGVKADLVLQLPNGASIRQSLAPGKESK